MASSCVLDSHDAQSCFGNATVQSVNPEVHCHDHRKGVVTWQTPPPFPQKALLWSALKFPRGGLMHNNGNENSGFWLGQELWQRHGYRHRHGNMNELWNQGWERGASRAGAGEGVTFFMDMSWWVCMWAQTGAQTWTWIRAWAQIWPWTCFGQDLGFWHGLGFRHEFGHGHGFRHGHGHRLWHRHGLGHGLRQGLRF